MVAGVRNGTPYATATDATDVRENDARCLASPIDNTYKTSRQRLQGVEVKVSAWILLGQAGVAVGSWSMDVVKRRT